MSSPINDDFSVWAKHRQTCHIGGLNNGPPSLSECDIDSNVMFGFMSVMCEYMLLFFGNMVLPPLFQMLEKAHLIDFICLDIDNFINGY